MTDFNWKSLLRDASLVGDGKGQLSTSGSTAIFKSVNQRRHNLAQQQGTAAQRESAAGFKPVDGTPAAMSDAALQVVSLGTHGGVLGAVAKPHYAAGSLYAFTFSEFLEALIHVALHLPPAVAGVPKPAGGLTQEYVLAQLRWLLHERVLLNARRGEVLEFRKMVVESSTLSDALEAINPLLDPLYERYAEAPAKVKGGAAGFSLKAFQEMCQEAELVGHELSLVDVKSAFVHSLLFGADEDGTRMPLLERTEFSEAVLRLALHYEPAQQEAGRGGRNAGVRIAARRAMDPGAGGKAGGIAAKLAAKVKSQLTTDRGLPDSRSPVVHPAEAGGTATTAPVALAPASLGPLASFAQDEGGGEDAEELHVEEAVATTAQEEAIILERLPLVVGKLLAPLDA